MVLILENIPDLACVTQPLLPVSADQGPVSDLTIYLGTFWYVQNPPQSEPICSILRYMNENPKLDTFLDV